MVNSYSFELTSCVLQTGQMRINTGSDGRISYESLLSIVGLLPLAMLGVGAAMTEETQTNS